jgi:NAD(P)-dependent dehydrogenase (short-subunit alcohol dehydrogenase family)
MGERAVLITGCSSGIGLASAREMKARGWRVFATARKPEDIARLKNEHGVESLYLDYAEPASIAEAAAHVLAATEGRLAALFNNGGYGQPGAVEDLTPEVLRAQFEANVFGWHDLTRRIIPAMRARGEGRIVFCSSVLGFITAPYRGAYCASKFAVEALADALRMELAGTGIHVSLIEPGPIATRFVEHAIEAYRRNDDMERSAHREVYRARLARMEEGGNQSFKLGPEAVAAKLVHALQSKRPKARYYVTFPTYAAALPRRLLPTRAIDAVAASNCRRGKQLKSGPGVGQAPNQTREGQVEDILRSIIPFALAAVAIVLLFGLWNMMRGGDPNLSQKLMRARVILQFIAIIIVMAVIYFAGQRP